MKRFNRKKLIPSLAASVMVAAATFAPLPGFLVSGSVAHADDAVLPHNSVSIESPATFVMSTHPSATTTTSTINVKVKYQCAPYNQMANKGTITLTLIQPTTLTALSTTSENLIPSPAILCNDTVQETVVTVTATTNGDLPSLGIGQASANALLFNSPNNLVAKATRNINIE